MIKYINLDYKNFEKEPSIYRIQSDFEKSAYAMADTIKEFIEKLKPNKDSNFYWINAMGAGETYGSNSRGDYFPRNELVNSHKTFVETPARVYIQHRNKDPQYSLGEVIYSFFNPDTDRVEVVERIDWPLVHKYAPDWIRFALQMDKGFNTSMGCKVAYDECSYCHNKSKTMAEYCPHLKTAMNQFIDNTHIHAINIGPKFFDNSIVQRGADRTARMLSKVASAEDEVVDMIQTDDEFNKSHKTYFFYSDNTNQEIKKYAESLPTFNRTFLDALCEYELPEILGTTKVAGCELKPEEFQYITLKKLGQEKQAEDLWTEGKVFELKARKKIALVPMEVNETLLSKIAYTIPDRTQYKPFVLFRNLHNYKMASESPTFSTFDGPLASVLSDGYINYYKGTFEKNASIYDLLLSLFLTLPETLGLAKAHSRSSKTERENILNVKNIQSQGTKVPLLPPTTNQVNPIPVIVSNAPMVEVRPGFYNPIMRNPFIESSEKKASAIGKALKYTALGGAAIAPVLYGAGVDKQREESGDERAGQGIAGTIRKHPILSTAVSAGAVGLANHALTKRFNRGGKTASADEYKEFLKSYSQEELLRIVDKIPDDVIEGL